MKEPKKAIRGSGRVAFLARLEGIKTMVQEGHPLLSIYQTYESDLPFRYSQFVKYVNRYIKFESVQGKPVAKKEVSKKPKAEGFTIDPKLNEDLY